METLCKNDTWFNPPLKKIEMRRYRVQQFQYGDWRSNCGVVMQMLYFSDTIAGNISVAMKCPTEPG